MTLLKEEEFIKLTKLCRINCSAKEKETLSQQIQRVVSYIDLLDELDTEGVTPCYQVNPTQPKVLREDKEGPLLSREKLLDNSPASVGGMVKIPAVMKTSN